jgi:hypothetical protein
LDRLLAYDRPYSVSKPLDVSLRSMGLYAPDGLACVEGGFHAVLEPDLQIASAEAVAEGMADVRCLKCGEPVDLRPLHEL